MWGADSGDQSGGWRVSTSPSKFDATMLLRHLQHTAASLQWPLPSRMNTDTFSAARTRFCPPAPFNILVRTTSSSSRVECRRCAYPLVLADLPILGVTDSEGKAAVITFSALEASLNLLATYYASVVPPRQSGDATTKLTCALLAPSGFDCAFSPLSSSFSRFFPLLSPF
jgi:hypothetical protein